MGRLVRIALCGALVATLAGCGGDVGPAGPPAPQEPTPSKQGQLRIGINPANGKTGPMIDMGNGLALDPMTGQVGVAIFP